MERQRQREREREMAAKRPQGSVFQDGWGWEMFWCWWEGARGDGKMQKEVIMKVGIEQGVWGGEKESDLHTGRGLLLALPLSPYILRQHFTFKWIKFTYLFFKNIYWFWLHQVLVVAFGIQFPDQGSNPLPQHWKQRRSQWTTREVPWVSIFKSTCGHILNSFHPSLSFRTVCTLNLSRHISHQLSPQTF